MVRPVSGPAQTHRPGLIAEGWPSGLRRTLGKRVYGKPYRGFESHSLRQLSLYINKLDKIYFFTHTRTHTPRGHYGERL